MRLLTEGHVSAIVPTKEDFKRFKQETNCDAETWEELFGRYKELSKNGVEMAVIELSMEEYNEQMVRHQDKLEKFLKQKGVPLSEITEDGRKIYTSQARSLLSSFIAEEMSRK